VHPASGLTAEAREAVRRHTTDVFTLDRRTLLEVLGGSPDPTAVAALHGEVLAVLGQFQSEVATGGRGSGVLLVRGRPVADFLDLDTLARLLGPAPRPRRDTPARCRRGAPPAEPATPGRRRSPPKRSAPPGPRSAIVDPAGPPP
jgi:hypothetical protein